MANYKESSIAGTSYTRCNYVTIHNDLGKPQRAFFSEEKVYITDDIVSKPIGGTETIFSPTGGFNLRSYDTGEHILNPDGSTKFISHLELRDILYSLYIDAAMNRDAKETTPPPPIV